MNGVVRGAAKFTDCEAFIDRLESDHIASNAHLEAYDAEQKQHRIATRKVHAEVRKAAKAVDAG